MYRYSDDGQDCSDAYKKSPIQEINSSGNTLFSEHSDRLEILFIAQAVLYCFYNCCIIALLSTFLKFGSLKIAQGMR